MEKSTRKGPMCIPRAVCCPQDPSAPPPMPNGGSSSTDTGLSPRQWGGEAGEGDVCALGTPALGKSLPLPAPPAARWVYQSTSFKVRKGMSWLLSNHSWKTYLCPSHIEHGSSFISPELRPSGFWVFLFLFFFF